MKTSLSSIFHLRGVAAAVAVVLATTVGAGASVMLATAGVDAMPAAHRGSVARATDVFDASYAADSVPTASSVFADRSAAADEAVATF